MQTYFYVPLPYYNGIILKCAGIVTESNRAHLVTQYPDGIELEYCGDRIWADSHKALSTLKQFVI